MITSLYNHTEEFINFKIIIFGAYTFMSLLYESLFLDGGKIPNPGRKIESIRVNQ